MVIGSEADMQGPVPSGSGAFQVNVTVVPISEADGVYIALAAFLFGLNVPVPPVQIAPLIGLAARVTFVIPQIILSTPAFEFGCELMMMIIASNIDVQGPVPSGSGTFHVNQMVVPISDNAGV